MTVPHILVVVWNTHSRIPKPIAEAHIREWMSLTPTPSIASPYAPAAARDPEARPDLDFPDELAVRSLLLGITHRSAEAFEPARALLEDAHALQPKLEVNTWVGGVAMFELAVLDLKVADATVAHADVPAWAKVLREANERLDKALALAGSNIDLSSRLDMRIAMLRDEIAVKREAIGIPQA